ncbi:MAG: hypothetical protein DMF63_02540 [Acidobacteria bacterium]|nr:MAG: hypothetical protein DMF63_02540 [Acidobacteriota bacterium]
MAAGHPKPAETQANTGAVSPAPMREYHALSLGMSPDDVEALWGKPKIKDEGGFLYNRSDSEMAQIEIGSDKKVSAIAVMFQGGKGAPSLTDVFGAGATADPRQNGTVYKMVRYPEAGYWVSYSATPGENGVTIITLRKL